MGVRFEHMKNSESTAEFLKHRMPEIEDQQAGQLDAVTAEVVIPEEIFYTPTKEYFRPNRRAGFREKETDRRRFLRPTAELRWRGFYAAMIAFAALSTLVILFTK